MKTFPYKFIFSQTETQMAAGYISCLNSVTVAKFTGLLWLTKARSILLSCSRRSDGAINKKNNLKNNSAYWYATAKITQFMLETLSLKWSHHSQLFVDSPFSGLSLLTGWWALRSRLPAGVRLMSQMMEKLSVSLFKTCITITGLQVVSLVCVFVHFRRKILI